MTSLWQLNHKDVKIPKLLSFNHFQMKIKQTLMRVTSGTLLVLALPIAVGAAVMTDTGFTDVSATNPNYNAIMYLKSHGVISGYPDGSFKPDQTVNRAEALKIILLGSGETVAASVDLEPFRDVPRAEWYSTYVAKAKELGVVSGYADGTFKPSQTVNLVENLKILLLTKKIDVSTLTVSTDPYADTSSSEWYAPYVQYSKDKNLIDADAKNMVYPAQGMTRGKLAETMYRLMYMKEMGLDKYEENTQGPTQQNTQEQTQQSTQQQAVNIDITNFAFVSDAVTVKAGTTVVWTNSDQVAHTITSDTGTTLSSGNLSTGQTYSMTFTTPGTYSYHCTVHPSMKGTVTVTQ